MHHFFLNLEQDKVRRGHWSEPWQRFRAIHYAEMGDDDPLFEKMISYHNVPPTQHRAKCGCFLTHLRMLEHIVDKKLNHVYVCEDDAQQVHPLPKPEELPDDGLTYLGGFVANKQISKKMDCPPNHQMGVNVLENRYRMIMLLAYYVPTWEVAETILKRILQRYIYGRVRAIDIELFNALPEGTVRYMYPASFIERPGQSSIRGKKVKNSTDTYEWTSRKKIHETT
jgi:hypothetical protein